LIAAKKKDNLNSFQIVCGDFAWKVSAKRLWPLVCMSVF